MSVIRVDPASIRQYAATAQGQFDSIRSELQGLVNDAVNVRYFGPNAVQFKTRCGQMAAEFGARIGRDLSEIADAVRSSTTAIATSLGGSPISISVNGAPLPVPPVPAGDGAVEIDTTGLDGLKPAVARHISAISSTLSAHLRHLQATDWQGQAKDAAVAAVASFTNRAAGAAADAQQAITGYIDAQVASVMAMDR
jgi:post-segregation antitoxin (ccd killing protein)